MSPRIIKDNSVGWIDPAYTSLGSLSSFGFHTLTVFQRLDKTEARILFNHFHEYRDRTKGIRVYVPKYERERVEKYKGLKDFMGKKCPHILQCTR